MCPKARNFINTKKLLGNMIMANENRTLVYVSFLFKETNGANILIYKQIKTINNNICMFSRYYV